MNAAQFGKYLLIEKLGRGRETDVFRDFLAVPAYARTTTDLLVIRQLHAGAHPGEQAMQAVAVPEDAKLACALQHPCIATAYEFGSQAGVPYWAVEFLKGKALDEVLQASQSSGGLPLGIGLKVVSDVLLGLEYAHSFADGDTNAESRGLVHGEVTPRNVFITYDGQVKLRNFCVHRTQAQRDSAQEREARSPYTAPEQTSAYGISPKVDIYAAGRLLEDIIANRETRPASGSITLTGLQPEPSLHIDAQPPMSVEPLAGVWRQATASDPDARYPSVRAMLEVLAPLTAAAEQSFGPSTREALALYMQSLFEGEPAMTDRHNQSLLDALDAQSRPSGMSDETAPSSRDQAAGAQPLAWWELDDRARQAPRIALDQAKTESTDARKTLPPPLPEHDALIEPEPEPAQPARAAPLAWWEQDDQARPRSSRPATIAERVSEAPAEPDAVRAVRTEMLPPPPEGPTARVAPLAWWEMDDKTQPAISALGRDAAEESTRSGDVSAQSLQLPKALPVHDASTLPTTPRLKLALAPSAPDDAAPPQPDAVADDAPSTDANEPSSAPFSEAPLALETAEPLSTAGARAAAVLATDRGPARRASLARLELPPTLPPPAAAAQADEGWSGRTMLAAAVILLGLLFGVSLLSTERSQSSKPPTAAAAATAPTPPNTPPALRMCGSNTVGGELAPALLEALFLAKDNAEGVVRRHTIDSDVTLVSAVRGDRAVSASVAARGSASAFQGLADGTCDVGMASRSIKAEEAQHLKELGLGDLTTDGNEHVIALDGVAVIVHPNNPVSQLDSQALHDIFTGKVSDWSELGGTPGKIQVLARDDDSGTYETFRATILGDDRLVEGAKRYMLSDALADAVAGIPGAIGFVGLPYVRTAKALAIGAPGAPPLLPTRFTVTTESYLLSRRLYLYTTDKPRSTWTTELLNFAQSARGQEAISKAKFVNLALFAEHHACSLEECTASYAATTANAARVSMDFHFTNHSSAPDSRARRDLDRLVEFLRDYRAVRLLLLGFSDNIGGPNSNIRLSRERAEVIAAQLRMRGLHPAVVTGFGDAMPLASNDTEQGRMRNRRVEVWVETDDAR